MKTFSYLLAISALAASQTFAQDGAAPAREQGFSQTLIMIGIALLFFYFILWRPEKKRRKALEERRSAMQKGDRVTAMGILGTIHRVEKETVIVKMYDGSKIEFLKAAISDVQAGTGSDKQPSVEVQDDDNSELAKSS